MYTMHYKYGTRTREFVGALFLSSFLYFGGVMKIIPLALVGK